MFINITRRLLRKNIYKIIKILIIYVILIKTIYFIKDKYFTYNLFEDALQKQNVTNFDIRCQNQKGPNQPMSRAEFIEKLLNNEKLINTLKQYETDKFKYCNLNQLRKNFKSKSVYYLNKFEFLLTSIKSNLPFFDQVLPGGSFYQTRHCIHNYLYYTYLKTHIIPEKESDIPIRDYKLLKGFIKDEQATTFIIIPYLNRENNLKDFLFNIHTFLQRQFLNSYQILVVEQFVKDPIKNVTFNKGRLYNMGYEYILREYPRAEIKCLIFHDVDLIPESDYNFYECDNFGDAPRHLSFYIRSENNGNKELYERNPYEMLVGGVLVIKPDIFEKINGFSNRYWNWGGEDDDLAMRMLAKNVCIKRPKDEYAVYKMSGHKQSILNPNREKMLFSSVIKMNEDGLSNLNSLNLSILEEFKYPLFTKIVVDVKRHRKHKDIIYGEQELVNNSKIFIYNNANCNCMKNYMSAKKISTYNWKLNFQFYWTYNQLNNKCLNLSLAKISAIEFYSENKLVLSNKLDLSIFGGFIDKDRLVLSFSNLKGFDVNLNIFNSLNYNQNVIFKKCDEKFIDFYKSIFNNSKEITFTATVKYSIMTYPLIFKDKVLDDLTLSGFADSYFYKNKLGFINLKLYENLILNSTIDLLILFCYK
ncbi:unnamed protein product, partial [Brachionus calyciflorus]